MAKERVNFIEGCKRVNGIEEKKANAIFDLLEKFAGYGFNKSHSAAYGLISYRTAYLKANYPVEFMAGLLSNESTIRAKFRSLSPNAKMGITICRRISTAALKFTPENHGEHRHSIWIGGIKNIGEGAMESAIREREHGGDFLSLEDFCADRFPHCQSKDAREFGQSWCIRFSWTRPRRLVRVYRGFASFFSRGSSGPRSGAGFAIQRSYAAGAVATPQNDRSLERAGK